MLSCPALPVTFLEMSSRPDVPARRRDRHQPYASISILEWFGTVRGRVGVLATPRVLLYGTGGLAYGSFKTTGALAGFNAGGVAVASLRLEQRYAPSAGRSAPASKA